MLHSERKIKIHSNLLDYHFSRWSRATGKSVVTVVQSFVLGPTATETKIETKTAMTLPRVVVCSSNRFNGTKIKNMNISDDLVTVLDRDVLPFASSGLPPALISRPDLKEILNRTRSEYLQLMKSLNITDHGQLLDTLFSSCPEVIKDCWDSQGRSIPCCETEAVFTSQYGICILLPQFNQTSDIFGAGLNVTSSVSNHRRNYSRPES